MLRAQESFFQRIFDNSRLGSPFPSLALVERRRSIWCLLVNWTISDVSHKRKVHVVAIMCEFQAAPTMCATGRSFGPSPSPFCGHPHSSVALACGRHWRRSHRSRHAVTLPWLITYSFQICRKALELYMQLTPVRTTSMFSLPVSQRQWRESLE